MSLHEQLGIDLYDLDQRLRKVVETDVDLPRSSVVYDSIVHLIAAGGKRLRPILAIVGGRFGDPAYYEAVMRTAVLLEYLHMASLVHDDIIDRSELRRGEPTIHKMTDVRSAIHVANYMMSRVVEWATGIGDEEDEAYRVAEIAGVVTELCMGEFMQLDNRFNFDLTLDAYLNKTKRKTAVLMAECLKAGATAANANMEIRELLYQFGEAIGIAFQIKDDVLDITKPQEAIGKPAGADLRNGNITLPVMLAMQSDPDLGTRIRELHAESPDECFDEVIDAIAKSPAPGRALEQSAYYAEQARAMIKPLEDHPSYPDLLVLADYFISG